MSKYPALKKNYGIPEDLKTETDLINAQEVKEGSDKFLGHYVEIAKCSDGDINKVLEQTAAEMSKQGIKGEHLNVSHFHLARFSQSNVPF